MPNYSSVRVRSCWLPASRSLPHTFLRWRADATPRLLGVTPEQRAERKAFTFAKVAERLSKENPWLLLDSSRRGNEADLTESRNPPPHVGGYEPNVVPAIGDEASIVWALGKKVGDTVDYTDERGRSFRVRLVGALANPIF